MDDPNRITLAIEAKSEWSESHPGRGLENAAKQLVKHAEKLKNSERLATDHGYAVYISIFPDKIEIHWKRVNIEG
ncbi:MAG: hypothetical protein QXI11_04870 [Thermoproteota archaeon]|nr:hypothetical protein [Candidatus Brockarchaeota archaeon]